jgi:hypothetical protein
MGADPEPYEGIKDFDRECAISRPDSDGTILSGLFEMERRMVRS